MLVLLSGAVVSAVLTLFLFTVTAMAALAISAVGLVRPRSRGPQDALVLFGGGMLVGPIAYSLLALAN